MSARSKIVTVAELADVVQRHRRAGRRVIQAHGTFDLLHLGHVRHLEAARRHADVLVVTVTADAFVKKGPDRPAFKHDQRAEMLAALGVVDHVAVDHHADAVPTILQIQPDLYVKGRDYANPEDDVTGKIVAEREAVESVGGAILFTDELTGSSSELLNRHGDVREPRLRAHLDRLRAGGGLARLLGALDAIRDRSVLVVGDAILDEYQYVAPMGKAGKESLVATRYQGEELFAGGVVATANHVASFCARVEVVTCVGDDGYLPVIERSLKPNVTLTALRRPGAPTTRKRRLVEATSRRKLFEVYFMDDAPLAPALQAELDETLARRLGHADVVIANDFGHGLIGPSTVELLGSRARFLAVNTQTNAGNHGYNLVHKYPRADYVCLDAEEARLAVTDRLAPIEEVIAERLPARVRCPSFIVTQGAQGCVVHRRGEAPETIPAVTRDAVDTMGAGDAFLAVTAPLCAAAGVPLSEVGLIGNVAGALKVGIVGHQQAVERIDLVKSLTALLR